MKLSPASATTAGTTAAASAAATSAIPHDVDASAASHWVVLMACYNRKKTTLACLGALFTQQLPAGLSFDVVLLDDASPDGTAAAVALQFPQVHLLAGDGQLYWNGGMRRAWLHALALFPKASAFIWLNDDVLPDADALARLHSAWLQAQQLGRLSAKAGAVDNTQVGVQVGAQVGALVGAVREPGNAKTDAAQQGANPPLSYGARRRLSRWWPLRTGPLLAVSSSLQSCDFINGNLCLIPAAVVAKAGILSQRFSHSMGDYDYGLRLQKAGFLLWQAPGSFGSCASRGFAGSVLDARLPMQQRLLMLKQPNHWPPASEWRLFIWRHGGPFRCLLAAAVTLRQCFPRLFLWWRQRKTPAGRPLDD